MQFSLRKIKHIYTILFSSVVALSLLAISIIVPKYTAQTDDAVATEDNDLVEKRDLNISNYHEIKNYSNSSFSFAIQDLQPPTINYPENNPHTPGQVGASTPTESGSIIFKVRDSVTRDENIPQGDASFVGIVFQIGNNNGYDISYNGVTAAPGEYLSTRFVTEENGEKTINPLPIGQYTVCEVDWNYSYLIPTNKDDACQTITVSQNNSTEVVFYNNVYTSGVDARVYDYEIFNTTYTGALHDAPPPAGECVPLGAGSFAGIIFNLYNGSENPIYHNGQKIEKDGLIGSGEVTENNCVVAFQDIPYSSFYVRMFGSATGYAINNNPSRLFDNHEYYDENKGWLSTLESHIFSRAAITRGGVKFTKINQNTNQPIANIPFEIKSNTTGEKHIVMSNENGVVDTSAVVHSQNTNGYDSISIFDGVTYQANGTWFGLDHLRQQLPVYDNCGALYDDPSLSECYLGSLPYDTYIITELSCTENNNCENAVGSAKEFNIRYSRVENLGTWYNDCEGEPEPEPDPIPTLSTTAVDAADNDKTINNATASIKDTVSYCLLPNQTYTLRGVLMDKSTNQKLVVNGSNVEVTQSLTVGAANNNGLNCGIAEMTFNFDASNLNGKSIVVFEYVTKGNDSIISHTDINDSDQTVTVNIPVPTLGTTARDVVDNDNIINNATASIKDTVSYCLLPSQAYTLRGDLRYTNGNQVLINGQPITAEKTFTTGSSVNSDGLNCNTTEMTFNFDASAISNGTKIVVYEEVFQNGTSIVSHKDPNDTNQIVTVNIPEPEPEPEPTLDTTAVYSLFNDNEVSVRDAIYYCLPPNQTYNIHGVLMDKSTNQKLVVNGTSIEADQAITTGLAGENGLNCGTVDMLFDFDATNINNVSIVVFEYVYKGQDLVKSHADINDDAQTVTIEIPEPEPEPESTLSTTAVDAADGDKTITADGTAKIKDTVSYCLLPNQTYKLKGTLMDKSINQKLTINDLAVEKEQTLTVGAANNNGLNCGTTEMFFEFDATDLGGKSIVVFEDLYYNDNLIISHNDINDEEQTVEIEKKDEPGKIVVPDTGQNTDHSGNNVINTFKTSLIIVIITTCVYGAIKSKSKKHKIDF